MKLYSADGKMLTSALAFCQPFGDQPAANGSAGSFININGDYANLLGTIYEPLRTKYPNYIKRKTLGRDASDNYDIYAYTFEPRYYRQSILLVAGIHANEPDAIACLARIMQMIADESEGNDVLMYLRQNVKINVVPCVNVWGFSQTPKKRTNADGVAIQAFTTEPPIAEVSAMKAYLAELKDELSFLMDMHTTTNDTYKDFYGGINLHDKNVRTIFRVNNWLCEHYAYQGGVDDQYLGYSVENTHLFRNYAYTLGVTSSTMELSDYHWDTKLSTAKVITMGVTMWLNYIFQQVLDEYKLIEDIPDSDYRPGRL